TAHPHRLLCTPHTTLLLCLLTRPPPRPTLFPYTTLFRSLHGPDVSAVGRVMEDVVEAAVHGGAGAQQLQREFHRGTVAAADVPDLQFPADATWLPRTVVAGNGARCGAGDLGPDVRGAHGIRGTHPGQGAASHRGAASRADRIHVRRPCACSRAGPTRRHRIERFQE